MSELLDPLARTLAERMPQRRALCTSGGALVTFAVPSSTVVEHAAARR